MTIYLNLNIFANDYGAHMTCEEVITHKKLKLILKLFNVIVLCRDIVVDRGNYVYAGGKV